MEREDAVIALERASQALDRIDKHEKVCSQRYSQIFSTQAAMNEKLDDIKSTNFNQWLVVAGGVITLLLSVVGLLFSKVMGWI